MTRSVEGVVANALSGGRATQCNKGPLILHTIFVSSRGFVQVYRALLGTTKTKTTWSRFINGTVKFMQEI